MHVLTNQPTQFMSIKISVTDAFVTSLWYQTHPWIPVEKMY